uniref:Uncharacterized protein n=1 Tax=Plectus sambesii TaxID=2011161 RepID=A0A914W5J2_9BILA
MEDSNEIVEEAPSDDGALEVRVRIVYLGKVLDRLSLKDQGCSSNADSSISSQVIKLKMPGELFEIVNYEWNVAPAFRRRMIRAFADKASASKFTVNIRLTSLAPSKVDHAWCDRISQLILRNLELEKLMWTLSTLGGAFSALGEYSLSFADRAARTSVEQLNIALELGDPILVSRCKLYIALSLAQFGRLRQAAEMVRVQHKKAMELRSELLRRCCLGIWAKLRQVRAARRRNSKDLSLDQAAQHQQ